MTIHDEPHHDAAPAGTFVTALATLNQAQLDQVAEYTIPADPVLYGAPTTKRYACHRCGHVRLIGTTHYGQCWSAGHINVCPVCPPSAKYPEFGGSTQWDCLDTDPAIAAGKKTNE